MPVSSRKSAPGLVPGFFRRMLCLFYEALLLVAVCFVAEFLALAAGQALGFALPRHAFQAYLIVVCAVYFVPQWHAGQTLAMKTWRIRLVTQSGERPGVGRALARYVFALLTWALCGAGYLWALVDRDRQFLHDRLARTRLVQQGG